jgi:hypothetical protein
MSTFVKYEKFVEDFGNKVHDLFGTNDTLKVALTNTAPNVATHTVLADITELSTANGYTAGGVDTQNDGTRSGGVLSVTGVDVTDAWTATGAGFTFRYAVLYNDTPAGDPLIGYWDYGSSQAVAAGETVSLNFGATLFTVT